MEGAQGARSMTRARALAAGACGRAERGDRERDRRGPQGQRPMQLAAKARSFLLEHQDKATGGWSVPEACRRQIRQTGNAAPSQPHMPGITGLVLRGLVMNPKMSHDDLAITSG